MNKATFVGRLIADPTYNEVAGVPVCNMTISVRTRGKDSRGYPNTVLVKCTMWRKLAEMTARFGICKGKMVGVSGMVDVEAYLGRDGAAKAGLLMDVDDIDYILTGEDKPAPAAAPASAAPVTRLTPVMAPQPGLLGVDPVTGMEIAEDDGELPF